LEGSLSWTYTLYFYSPIKIKIKKLLENEYGHKYNKYKEENDETKKGEEESLTRDGNFK